MSSKSRSSKPAAPSVVALPTSVPRVVESAEAYPHSHPDAVVVPPHLRTTPEKPKSYPSLESSSKSNSKKKKTTTTTTTRRKTKKRKGATNSGGPGFRPDLIKRIGDVARACTSLVSSQIGLPLPLKGLKGKHVVAAAVGGATLLSLVRLARNLKDNKKKKDEKKEKRRSQTAGMKVKTKAVGEKKQKKDKNMRAQAKQGLSPDTTCTSECERSDKDENASSQGLAEKKPVIYLEEDVQVPQSLRGDATLLQPVSLKATTAWGRALLFFLVPISMLEMVRQVNPEDFGLIVQQQVDYQSYILFGEKLFGLCLAWYLTVWVTLFSMKNKRTQRPSSMLSKEVVLRGTRTQESDAGACASQSGSFEEVDVTGIWIKDRKRSDNLAPLCRLARINILLSKAICLVKGSELKQTKEGLTIRVFSEIPWFSLNEKYEFGKVALNRRRDFRKGKMECSMEKTRTGLKFVLKWPEPWSGFEETYYILSDEGRTLSVKTDCTIRGESISYTTVYHKRQRRKDSGGKKEQGIPTKK